MTVHFETSIYHPNITADGEVIVNLLGEEWCPALTISSGKLKELPIKNKRILLT
jgi:ubiquitin-protein ligase